MTTIEFDGETLTAHGKNKAARFALAGQDHAEDVRIGVAEIATAHFKKASALVNGNLTIETTEGRKYQLHFRKKQQADFEELARALGVPSQ